MKRLRRGTVELEKRVGALYDLLASIYGADRLVLKATKLEALAQLNSRQLGERIAALKKLVLEDPTLESPRPEEWPQLLSLLENELSDHLARRALEDRIERRMQERMEERHQAYLRDIRLQVIKEEGGNESATTLKRFAQLEKLESVRLAAPLLQMLRPARLDEMVGQEGAIRALLAKLSSPFPQHVLLYGPPGTGKTTAARLALEAAKASMEGPFRPEAPFVEVDGTTLRWDPREVTNPLLGSVHDPIYQGARRELAEGGVPEPKPGLVTEAHGGVLFIDEIGELDPMLQNKLLKVIEDKRVFFESSYYDANDAGIPKYIRKLFDEGAPADFVLIGATTRDPEELSPALRSRCGEIHFDPLTPPEIGAILEQAAARLKVKIAPAVRDRIADFTIEGRKAVGILADAYGFALQRSTRPVRIRTIDVDEVIRSARLSPYLRKRSEERPMMGRAWGLGVRGHLGSVLEIEATAFPAVEGKGSFRFNETAGSMTRDSVHTAASVIRRLTGEDLARYDLHVNVVGGGQVDGPSAGLAILVATLSAVTGRAVRQDVAMTGEVSLRGELRPVGGIYEKIFGAKEAGMRLVLIPRANRDDIPGGLRGIEVREVGSVDEALKLILVRAPSEADR